jgi:DNA uptake protein ComE-like DNA-binding protein
MKRSGWHVAAVFGVIAILVPLTAIAQSDTQGETPAKTEPAKAAPAKTTPAKPAAATAKHTYAKKRAWKAMDLNSASREYLMKLPGVTQETADAIIAARPLKSGKELVSKKVLTEAQWTKIAKRVKVAPVKAKKETTESAPGAPKSDNP